MFKKLNEAIGKFVIKEGLQEPTGELAIFYKRLFNNVNNEPDKDFSKITDYSLSKEDAEQYIHADIGMDKPGCVYQIRNKEGNIIKEVKWTDVYTTEEQYNDTIEYLFNYGNMAQIEYVLKLLNPNVSQEKIDKRLQELQELKDKQQRRHSHMYFDGATWESFNKPTLLKSINEKLESFLNENKQLNEISDELK